MVYVGGNQKCKFEAFKVFGYFKRERFDGFAVGLNSLIEVTVVER